MKKILLACDLDNTLLHSHRRRQADSVCVERLEGREQSFLSPGACSLLRRAIRETLFVPVTTRSVEQYQRIQWPEGCAPAWAATANGAVLLQNGIGDTPWQEESLEAVRRCRAELGRLSALLTREKNFRVCRMVDGMYLFASFESETLAAAQAEQYRGKTPLTVLASGRKLYFFPPGLDKGRAVLRLRKRLSAEQVVCAGDSVIDLPMLCAAQAAVVPDESLGKQVDAPVVHVCGPGEDFARFVLETALAYQSEKERTLLK